jgi:tRNA-specific 2-thiouridylase
MPNGKNVAVGMSGGVDSAVAALLLKEQGYNVLGLFMHNWEEEGEDGVCAAAADYEDVKAVCGAIGIPYYSVNFAREYRENVFNYFLAEYKAGRTPNPDVLCNREIKFGPFLNYALGFGADYIATGHYCGVEKKDGKNYLLKAADQSKDQTYFLNQVSAAQLTRVLFPLANLKKSEVRARAAAAKLPVAEKKDSTGLCFIGERDFKKFLSGFLPAQPGTIKTADGQEVGRHDGLMFYTLGQRRGLNIGGKQGVEGRWFVVKKDLENNVLHVSCGDEKPLYSDGLISGKPNWIPSDCVAPILQKQGGARAFHCAAKFRYRQTEQGVTVRFLESGGLRVKFDEPQRAVMPGQYVVFYEGRYCLGGAVIDATFKR